MNLPMYGYLLSSWVCAAFTGYGLARIREQSRQIRELKLGNARVDVILAEVKRRGGWLKYSEYVELVTIWPGFAPLIFQGAALRVTPPDPRASDRGFN